MKVVSNTSPIIFLSKVDALDLLPRCFERIIIPRAVRDELQDLTLPVYIEDATITPTGAGYVHGSIGRLHAGELEAIVLATEIEADYILMDDLLARRKAQRVGPKIIGTIGILLLAHKRQYLIGQEVKEKLMQLTQEHGMHVSRPILEKVLVSLHETNAE